MERVNKTSSSLKFRVQIVLFNIAVMCPCCQQRAVKDLQ